MDIFSFHLSFDMLCYFYRLPETFPDWKLSFSSLATTDLWKIFNYLCVRFSSLIVSLWAQGSWIYIYIYIYNPTAKKWMKHKVKLYTDYNWFELRLINWLILTVCQSVKGYFMPRGWGIALFISSYLHFLKSCFQRFIFRFLLFCRRSYRTRIGWLFFLQRINPFWII